MTDVQAQAPDYRLTVDVTDVLTCYYRVLAGDLTIEHLMSSLKDLSETWKALRKPAAPVAPPVPKWPEKRDNGKPNRWHEFNQDPETQMCVICGWAEQVHATPVVPPVAFSGDTAPSTGQPIPSSLATQASGVVPPVDTRPAMPSKRELEKAAREVEAQAKERASTEDPT